MPANTQYLLTAYGIVISVIVIYGIGMMLKLKSTNLKLKNLQRMINNETKES